MRGPGRSWSSGAATCRFLVVRLVAAVAWLAPAAGGLAQSAPEPASHLPGRLVIKVADALDVGLDEVSRRRGSVAAAIPGTGLDALGLRFGVRGIHPLRHGDAATATLAERRASERARQQRARGRRAARPPAGGATRSASFASVYVVDLAPDADVREAARAYAADPIVEWAQPDWVRRTMGPTNDPFAASAGSWGQGFADLWGVPRTSAEAAWDTARGAGVVIAISDSGVDTTHPDLAANLWVNPGEIAANGVDDDDNGYADDVNGWSFVPGAPWVEDDNGHGTHVAGTAAAVGDNGVGIVGIAPGAKVMAVKGIEASGLGADSWLAAGLLYALENGADVVNASWGSWQPNGASPVLDAALDALEAAGVAFVAAAGNSGLDVHYDSTWEFVPASHPHAFAVAASDHLDQKASFSNLGPKIDLAAPGGGDQPPPAEFPNYSILSLLAAHATWSDTLKVGGGYVRLGGTSMAAPHVAGAVAVLLSAHPTWDPELVRSALRAGADDTGAPGWDVESGHGRLNVAAALGVHPLAARIVTPASATVVSTETLAVVGSAHGPTFASYSLDYASLATPTSWTPLTGAQTTPVVRGPLATVSLATLPQAQYYLRLTTRGTDGAAFEDRVRLTVDRVHVASPRFFDVLNDATVVVSGSVNPGGFQRYGVEYNLEQEEPDGAWQSAGIILPGGGTSPVDGGVLATLDTSVLPRATYIAFRVLVETTAGSVDERVTDVVVDRDVREGWPVQIGYSHARSFSPNVADVDGDGTKDILLAVVGHLGVFRADGTSLPGWPQQLWNEVGPHWSFAGRAQPAVADMDGDGRLEIAITTTGRVFLYRHDGTLVDGWPVAYALEDTDIVFADVDGDSLPELLTVVDHGPGWGSPLAAELLALERDGTPVPGFPKPLAFGEWNPHMAIGDATGDGVPEIAVTYWQPAFERPGKMYGYLLDLAGNALWKRPVRYGKAPWAETSIDRRWILPTPPAMGDVDGDGLLDVILAPNRPGKLRAYRGDGRPARARLSMKLPRFRSDRNEDRSEQVAVGDLTGDGVPEVVYATNLSADPALPAAAGTDYLVAMDPVTRTQVPGWPVAFPFRGRNFGLGLPSIGDIDGDGRQEVVVATKHCAWAEGAPDFFSRRCRALHAFRADGTPVPGFPRPTTNAAPLGDAQVAIADLENDGLVELIWVDSGAVQAPSRLFVWTIPGAGAPAPHAWPMLRRDPQHTGALPP